MQVNCRPLREKVTDLKKDLNELKDDYTTTVSYLKRAKTKCLVISTKLEEAAPVKQELGFLADRLSEKNERA
jgi:hypothetical protein